jgi:membrane protein implicated in regulation of membrane protease activity
VAWWLWVLLGFALMLGEVVTPGGFFFLFFGVAGLVVGALVWAGLGGPAWAQWLLFTVVSLACLVPLRARLLRRVQGDGAAPVDSLVGAIAVSLEDLAPGQVGKAELRGTAWSARNAGTRPIPRGARSRVVRVDGLMLWLESE